MWSQFPGTPNLIKLSLKRNLIAIILSATDLISAFHSAKYSGVFNILAATIAPCLGGLEYYGLITNFT